MTFSEFLRYLFLIVFLPHSLKTMEWRMLRLLNRDRKMHRLKPVRMQDDLREVARKHSKDMADKDYFAHENMQSHTHADRLRLAGVSDVVSGENLAKIGGFPNPTQFAEEGLMNSPGHRANILNGAYNAVGIGVIQSHTQIYYFTQNFAKRDLLFKKRPPKSIKVTKALHLSGEVFSNVSTIVYQILVPGQQNPLNEKIIPIHEKKFAFQLSFAEIGLYEVRLYVAKAGQKTFTLANSFEVKVKKGWAYW
jgi:hypothetical protein